MGPARMPVKKNASIFADKKSQGDKECGQSRDQAPADKNVVE
jgi:hypothetical protein